jgi:hypothetical protein
MPAENAKHDLPPLGFCILFLLGSKYAAKLPALGYLRVAHLLDCFRYFNAKNKTCSAH